jgi:hypothetical protein
MRRKRLSAWKSDVLTAVIVAEPKASGDVLGEAAMALADGLLDRREGWKVIGVAAGPRPS